MVQWCNEQCYKHNDTYLLNPVNNDEVICQGTFGHVIGSPNFSHAPYDRPIQHVQANDTVGVAIDM